MKQTFFSIGAKIFVALIALTIIGLLAYKWHTSYIETIELRAAKVNSDRQANDEKEKRLFIEDQQARADRKADEDEANQKARDQITAAMVSRLTAPQQNQTALEMLAVGGFLDRKYFEGKNIQVSPDTTITKAVATQGLVLEETRQQRDEANRVRRLKEEQLTDLEVVYNGLDAGITDVRMETQDYVAERGVLRGHSRAQFRKLDRSLSEIQKAAKRLKTRQDTTGTK